MVTFDQTLQCHREDPAAGCVVLAKLPDVTLAESVIGGVGPDSCAGTRPIKGHYSLRPRPGSGSSNSRPNRQNCLDAGTDADARAKRERRNATAEAFLSIGHNSSKPDSKLRIWTEGAMAEFPAIPDWAPRPCTTPKPSKRGKVSKFSIKSRTRLQRSLSSIKVDEEAYTTVLTLPGTLLEIFSYDFTQDAFTKFMRRLSDDKRFSEVSGHWKRELQKRGAIHYHLLIYGLADAELRTQFHAFLVAQWTSFFSSYLSEQDAEHHRWWHARSENMELVEEFHSYFAKYISKDVDPDGLLSGRWWGSFNKEKLPVSTVNEVPMEQRAKVILHRLARKRRQNRANEGKHSKNTRILEERGAGILALDRWQLHQLRCGYDLNGFRNPARARSILECYQILCAKSGIRPSKVRIKGPRTAKITLCGKRMPAFAIKALQWANSSLGLVKPMEPPRRDQADFLADLGEIVDLDFSPRK